MIDIRPQRKQHLMVQHSIKITLFLVFSLLTHISKGQLQANFKADTTQGCGALANVQFTDLSTGNITSWSWNFGNGNTSPLPNPTASYASPGTYTVTLTVGDGTNTVSETKTGYIRVFRNPSAAITVNGTTTGCPPLPVQFSSSSSIGDGPITQYIWDFGDGSPAGTSANVTHSYQTGGTYPVSLQIIDQNGCSDNAIFNSVNVTQAPVANFTTSGQRSGCTVPHTVNFISTSQGSNLSYLWDFGDGATSQAMNPSHTYTALGDYNVSLKVTDPNCSNTKVENNYIKIRTVNVNFSIPDSICFGIALQPQNLSSGTTLYNWNFGDNTNSNTENPSHIYADSGWYRITLTASNGPVCLGTAIDSIYVQKMEAEISINKSYFCEKADSAFLKFDGYNIDRFHWRLHGLKDDSTVLNPYPFTVTYNGQFKDSLFIENKLGCRDTVFNDSIREVKFLQAWIKIDSSGGCIPFVAVVSDSSNMADSLIHWTWEIPNQGIVMQRVPDTIRINSKDTSTLILQVTGQLGCKASDTLTIRTGKTHNITYTLDKDTICPFDTVNVTHLTPSLDSVSRVVYAATQLNGTVGISDSFPPYALTTNRPGYYTLAVTVFDNGCVTKLKEDSAFFVGGTYASFTYDSDCASRNLVQFQGVMLGYGKFYWDFGDGSPIDSVNLNPLHLFDTSISLRDTVTFTVVDTSGKCPSSFHWEILDFAPYNPGRMELSDSTFCIWDTVYGDHAPPTLATADLYWVIEGDTISGYFPLKYKFDTGGTKVLQLDVKEALGCIYHLYDTIFISDLKASFTHVRKDSCLPVKVVFQSTSISDTSISYYKWDFGNDTSNLSLDSTIYNQVGKFDVQLIVEDAIGCRDTLLKPELIETDGLTVNFTSPSQLFCQFDSTFFNNLSKGQIDSILWDFGDGHFSSANTPTHQYVTSGKFDISLTIIDSLGCKITTTKSQYIDVQAKPVADFTSDTSQSSCYPLAVNFEDLSSGSPVKWEWEFGDNSSSVFEDPFHNYTLPGKYDVELKVESSAGCRDTILKPQYIQTNGPVATLNISKDSVCVRENIRFEMLNPQDVFDFTWDFGDGNTSKSNPANHAYNKTGMIYPNLIISDATGLCVISLEDSIYVENVKADFDLSDTLACGLPAQIDFNSTSLGAASHQWTIEGNTFNSVNTSYTFNQFGTYQVRLYITSTIGCDDFIVKEVKVAPKPNATVSPDTGLCEGDTIQLMASGGIRYEWTPNRFILPNNSNLVQVFPDTSIQYTVKVFNAEGCFDEASVNITVPKLKRTPDLKDTTLYLGENLSLNINLGEGLNYSWTPNIGLSCSDCPNPTLMPLSSQQYVLHTFDDYGCISLYDTIQVNVIEDFSIDVPNAFTPNGDQINDIIYVKGWGIKSLNYFRIYNRFGELVFESTDLNSGWNGTYKGVLQASDTYAFVAEVETFKGELLVKKGNISLIR